MTEMSYRHETDFFAGLVQQTVRYVGKGYRYYVVGEIPKRRQDNPEQIDAVLLHKFDIEKVHIKEPERRRVDAPVFSICATGIIGQYLPRQAVTNFSKNIQKDNER